MLPLLEAKMIHLYDSKWATYEPDGSTRDVTRDEKQDADFVIMPRYWVPESEVDSKLEGRWDNDWLLGWRRIGRSTDERTMIMTALPRVAIPDKLALMFPSGGSSSGLQSIFSSLTVDYVARQKGGGVQLDMFLVKQLPVLNLEFSVSWIHLESWIEKRVERLNGRPDASHDELVAELDAAMFHLYEISRGDTDYIIETFPIVKRKDIAAHGEFRTKRLVLEFYDAIGSAIEDGRLYESPLNLEVSQ